MHLRIKEINTHYYTVFKLTWLFDTPPPKKPPSSRGFGIAEIYEKAINYRRTFQKRLKQHRDETRDRDNPLPLIHFGIYQNIVNQPITMALGEHRRTQSA